MINLIGILLSNGQKRVVHWAIYVRVMHVRSSHKDIIHYTVMFID